MFLVLIGVVCTWIEYRISVGNASKGLPPKVNPDNLNSSKYLD
jgi:hypothetical protein